jgi:hypothetical protein
LLGAAEIWRSLWLGGSVPSQVEGLRCGSKIAAVIAACACALVYALVATASNPVVLENAQPGDRSWAAPYASGRAIEGYSSELSVFPGDPVHLHVSTLPAEWYRVRVFRLGWYGGAGGRLLFCEPGCGTSLDGQARPLGQPDPVTGEVRAGWPVTDTVVVPADAVSGYYVAELSLVSGPQRGAVAAVPFVVRSRDADPSRVLVQVPVTTWEAYNPWGGSCLYSQPVCERRAVNVSFDRPFAWTSPLQDPIHWELPLIHFLERAGIDVSYQADIDTDIDPSSLLRHRAVIVAGHSEYWTKAMFDGFDAARDAGTNLAFMGANAAYWQVRYEQGGRRIVSYKYGYTPDPIADPALKTTRFSELQPPRYECELVGVQHLGGSFRHKADDYTVNADALADPWFKGTGFTTGSVVPRIVSPERDDIPPGQAQGQACGHPMVVLFQHPETGALDAAKAIRYTATSGARVFATGSHDFAAALDPLSTISDPRLQTFMLNALDDLGRPAAPTTKVISRKRGTVIAVTTKPDPRILGFRIVRHDGTQTSLLTACRRPGCFDRTPPGPSTTYEAVTYDRWDSSAPTVAAAMNKP